MNIETKQFINNLLSKSNVKKTIVTPKLWGCEIFFIPTSDEYTEHYRKLLCLDTPWSSSSIHCHKDKIETFICLHGKVTLEFLDGDEREEFRLEPGVSITISPNTYHKFYLLEDKDAVILEIATHLRQFRGDIWEVLEQDKRDNSKLTSSKLGIFGESNE